MAMDSETGSRVASLVVKYRQLIRGGIVAAGIYAIALGLGTLIGGDVRLAGPSYTSASQLAAAFGVSPSLFWGASSILVGALTLAPRRKVSQCGLFALVILSTFLAVSFLASANVAPLAGVSGIFAHWYIAVVALALWMARVVDCGT